MPNQKSTIHIKYCLLEDYFRPTDESMFYPTVEISLKGFDKNGFVINQMENSYYKKDKLINLLSKLISDEYAITFELVWYQSHSKYIYEILKTLEKYNIPYTDKCINPIVDNFRYPKNISEMPYYVSFPFNIPIRLDFKGNVYEGIADLSIDIKRDDIKSLYKNTSSTLDVFIDDGIMRFIERNIMVIAVIVIVIIFRDKILKIFF